MPVSTKRATSDQANWSGTAGANGKQPQIGNAGDSSSFWHNLGRAANPLNAGTSRGGAASPPIRAPQVPKAIAQSAVKATPTPAPKPQVPQAPKPPNPHAEAQALKQPQAPSPAQQNPFYNFLGQAVGQAASMQRGGSALAGAAFQHTQQLGLNPFQRGVPQAPQASPGGYGGRGFDFSQLMGGGQSPGDASQQSPPPQPIQAPRQTLGQPEPGTDWLNGTSGETLGESAINVPAGIAANQALTSAAMAGFNRFKGTGVGQALGFEAPAGSGLTAAQRARVMLRPRNLARNLRGGAANMAAWNTGIDALMNAPNAFRNYKALATGQQYDPAVQQQYLDHAENLGSQNILRRAWGGFTQPITTIASGAHAIPELMQLRQQEQDFAYRTRGTREEQINRHANSNAAHIQDAQQATPDLWYQDSSSGQMLPTRKWMAQVNSPEEAAQRDRVLKRLGLSSGWSPAQ